MGQGVVDVPARELPSAIGQPNDASKAFVMVAIAEGRTRFGNEPQPVGLVDIPVRS